MATFLQLCQSVARESGTVSGDQPASVVSQVGRLAKIVGWTRTAWTRIQNDRSGWLWMRKPFSGVTLEGNAAYTAASWAIADHAAWLLDSMTAYGEAVGRADEAPLRPVDWDRWMASYDRGAPDAGRPGAIAVRPHDGALMLGPVPDGAYVVRGEYRMRPQVLQTNGDVPALPERFHDVIVHRALMMLHEHDEAPESLAYAAASYRDLLSDLQRDQLPAVRLSGGSLA